MRVTLPTEDCLEASHECKSRTRVTLPFAPSSVFDRRLTQCNSRMRVTIASDSSIRSNVTHTSPRGALSRVILHTVHVTGDKTSRAIRTAYAPVLEPHASVQKQEQERPCRESRRKGGKGCVCVCVCLCARMCVCVYIYIYMYIYTSINTYTYTYIYI